MDLLITERKEAQQAAQSDESTKRQKEADNNAYLSLMPLALPAPPTGGTSDFSGRLLCTSRTRYLFHRIRHVESFWAVPH